jgi:hypothetical protein
MRQIPFPVIEGERMVIEAIAYRRMLKHFLIRCLNEATTVKDYQPTGLSATARRVWLSNPRRSAHYSPRSSRMATRT